VLLVSMGVMNADNPNLVKAALDGGMFLLDTAARLSGWPQRGVLGTVLPSRKRDSFVLCTRIRQHLDAVPGSSAQDARRRDYREASTSA